MTNIYAAFVQAVQTATTAQKSRAFCSKQLEFKDVNAGAADHFTQAQAFRLQHKPPRQKLHMH